MNIHGTYYSLKYKSFDIVHYGCSGVCHGCHNKHLHDFNKGTSVRNKKYLNEIINRINKNKEMIDWVWIYGGEPLEQKESELIYLLENIKEKTDKPIMLWTRFNLKEVPESIKELVEYIKTGRYEQELSGQVEYYGVVLETTNQRIYKKGDNNEWN